MTLAASNWLTVQHVLDFLIGQRLIQHSCRPIWIQNTLNGSPIERGTCKTSHVKQLMAFCGVQLNITKTPCSSYWIYIHHGLIQIMIHNVESIFSVIRHSVCKQPLIFFHTYDLLLLNLRLTRLQARM